MSTQQTNDILAALAQTIAERKSATAEASYTKSLLDGGPLKCAKKFGEEAVEFVLAVTAQEDAQVQAEAADVLYHLLVALSARDVDVNDVLKELERRMGTSGHAEKSAREAGS
ncbi:MAG: phosphoribosyl-ATP diphosphatase [Pseudomonadota bacterium]